MIEETNNLPSQDFADSERSGDRRLSTCSGLVADMQAILRSERVLYRLKGRGMFNVPARRLKTHFREIKFRTLICIPNTQVEARDL